MTRITGLHRSGFAGVRLTSEATLVGLARAISWVRCASVSLPWSEGKALICQDSWRPLLWWVKSIFDISVLRECPAMFRRLSAAAIQGLPLWKSCRQVDTSPDGRHASRPLAIMCVNDLQAYDVEVPANAGRHPPSRLAVAQLPLSSIWHKALPGELNRISLGLSNILTRPFEGG
jgi:hypothetical protein